MSHPGFRSADTISIDLDAARHLVDAMAATTYGLATDEIALGPLLEEASRLLVQDRAHSLLLIRGARVELGNLREDLGRRVRLLDDTRLTIERIDELTTRISQWGGHPNDPARGRLTEERRALLLVLVGGDPELGARVEELVRAGRSVPEALREAAEEVVEEAAREARSVAVAEELGISLPAARQMVDRVDRNLVALTDRRLPESEAIAAVALLEQFGLELEPVLERMDEVAISIHDAIGAILMARGLGLDLDAYDALGGLETSFEIFDNATGGRRDGFVTRVDLLHVVDTPWRFTSGQVAAAQAMLDQPALLHRLDSAHENEEVLGGESFGRTEPADGLISAGDLRSFMLKSQLHSVLHEHADAIDVAADPSNRVDGFYSRNDFEDFLADNPDLPDPVVAAASAMIEAGYFDENWWQEHKDELALGAALAVGGIVIVATGGTAGVLVVAGAGAAAAGGTTAAINWANDEDMLDDVVANSVKGLFVAAGAHGVSSGIGAYGAATTNLAQSAALAEVATGATEVVGGGGVDLLLPEAHEESIHDIATTLSAAATAWSTTARRDPLETSDGLDGVGADLDALRNFEGLDDPPGLAE